MGCVLLYTVHVEHSNLFSFADFERFASFFARSVEFRPKFPPPLFFRCHLFFASSIGLRNSSEEISICSIIDLIASEEKNKSSCRLWPPLKQKRRANFKVSIDCFFFFASLASQLKGRCLSELCTQYGLDDGGLKSDLENRLHSHLQGSESATSAASTAVRAKAAEVSEVTQRYTSPVKQAIDSITSAITGSPAPKSKTTARKTTTSTVLF